MRVGDRRGGFGGGGLGIWSGCDGGARRGGGEESGSGWVRGTFRRGGWLKDGVWLVMAR